MIKLEVSGETAEEFAQNALQAFGVLAIGLQNAVAQLRSQQADVQTPSTASSPTSTSSTASPPSTPGAGTPSPSVPSDKLDDLFVKGGPEVVPEMEPLENPKVGEASPKPASSGKASKGTKQPKLDDLKTRLSEVITAAAERWDVKRANAYARKLLGEYKIAKLGDLDPSLYQNFLGRSAAYVDGNEPE